MKVVQIAFNYNQTIQCKMVDESDCSGHYFRGYKPNLIPLLMRLMFLLKHFASEHHVMVSSPWHGLNEVARELGVVTPVSSQGKFLVNKLSYI